MLSVIIPVFNAEDYIANCLESVLRQTLADIEVILVDDGSTDDSVKIIREHIGRDGRIRLISQENRGAAAARNNGILHARGDYVGFVDADDWVDEEMFEKLSMLAIKENADIVFSGYRIMAYGREAKRAENPFGGEVLCGDDEIFELRKNLYGGAPNDQSCEVVPVVSWTNIYRREFLIANNLRFENIRFSEDQCFNIRASRVASCVAVSSGVFYNYRKDNPFSVTANFDEDTVDSCLKSCKSILALAGEEGTDERISSCVTRANRFIMTNCRSWLFKIERLHLSRKQKRALVDQILNSQVLAKALNRYPCEKLPFWENLVARAMRRKSHAAIEMFSLMRNALKRW